MTEGKSVHRRRFSDGMLDNGLILRELDIKPGRTVVDAGCGNGYMTMLFSDRVGPEGTVYGLDLNIDVFTSTFPGPLPANVSVMACDMTERIPLADGCADLVYISTVLHSIPRNRAPGLVREFGRVIRAGGTLAVVEMAKRETPFGPPVRQRYSPEELQEVFPFRPMKTVDVAEHFYMQLFQVVDGQ